MGIEVHAIEARPELPGVHTSAATVHEVSSLAGPALIRALLELADRIQSAQPPVLFLTNDGMVRDVAAGWSALAGRYRLSWAEARDEVASLLAKTEHERASIRAGCRYPRSLVLESASCADRVGDELAYPLIAKPSRPLSSFKTAQIRDIDDLRSLMRDHVDALPIVVQPFIPGGDERIHFCAVYLHRGQVVARFDGRKLRSRPMGHTTIAEPAPADDVFQETARFFASTRISGPASLEMKRDPEGSLWVIEPTVGRTDFWIQVCISNGVNLPWLEYCDQTARALPQVRQASTHVWVNTERDPKALGVVLLGMVGRSVARRRIVLPYFHRGDRWLALRAAVGKARRNVRSRLARKDVPTRSLA